MTEIELSKNKKSLIDEDDIPFVSSMKWYAKNCRGKFYAARSEGRKTILLHRLLMGNPPFKEAEIDHINGNGLDNRKSNLRWCSRRQNLMNKVGVCGVRKARNKFQARITIDKKLTSLGLFKTEHEALMAYKNAARTMLKGN